MRLCRKPARWCSGLPSTGPTITCPEPSASESPLAQTERCSWRAAANSEMLEQVIGTKALLHWKMREVAGAFNTWNFVTLAAAHAQSCAARALLKWSAMGVSATS